MKKFLIAAGIMFFASGCASVSTGDRIFRDSEIGLWNYYGDEEIYDGLVYFGDDEMPLTPQEQTRRYYATSGFVDNISVVAKCMEYSYTTSAEGAEIQHCAKTALALMDTTGHLLNRFGEYNYPEFRVIDKFPPKISFVTLAGEQQEFPMWHKRMKENAIKREHIYTEDRLLIEHDGLYGFVDRTGRAIIAARFWAVENFKDGKARVISDQGFGTIDAFGKFVPDEYACITPYNDTYRRINIGGSLVNFARDIRSETALYVSHNLMNAVDRDPNADKVCTGGKWGLIDASDKVIIPPEYDRIEVFDGKDLILVQDFSRDVVGYYDREGNIIFKPEHPNVILGEHFTLVQNAEKKYALYTKQGTPMTAFEYDDFKTVSAEESASPYIMGETLVISKNGKWGLVSKDGKVMIPFEYDELLEESEGLIPFRKNKRWGVIDTENKEIMSPIYSKVGVFQNGRATAELAGDEIYIYRDDYARNAWLEKERLQKEREQTAEHQAQVEARQKREAREQEQLELQKRQNAIIIESEIIRLQKEIQAIDNRLEEIVPHYEMTKQESIKKEIDKLQLERIDLEDRIQRLTSE